MDALGISRGRLDRKGMFMCWCLVEQFEYHLGCPHFASECLGSSPSLAPICSGHTFSLPLDECQGVQLLDQLIRADLI